MRLARVRPRWRSLCWLALLPITAVVFSLTSLRTARTQAASFSFGAVGDHGANSNTSATLDLIPGSGASFFISLGDLSYSELQPESAWCDYVKGHVGSSF